MGIFLTWRNLSAIVSFALAIILIVLLIKTFAPSPSVSPISSNNFHLPEESRYKHYWEPTPNQVIDDESPEWLGYQPKYTINSDGLNERYEYEQQPPNHETFRIAALGDSWTFGEFINTKDNFPEVLEDMLNRRLSCPQWNTFEVINLGVPGHDIQYSVERFHRKGQKYNPNLLVWLLIENDFDEIGEYMREYIKESGGELPGVNRMMGGNALRSYLEARERLYREVGEEFIYEHQRAAISSIRDYFPNQLLLYTLASASGIDVEYQPILKEAAESSLNTQWFNSRIKLRTDELSLPDQHPSAAGHAAIAENLFHYLLAHYLHDCRLVE